MSESHARRQQILQSIVASPTLALRTATTDGRDDHARAAALTALVDALLAAGVTDMILESRGAARDTHDRRTLTRLLTHRTPTLTFRHVFSHDESLLWIADACAWSAGAGGRYAGPISTLLARP